MECAGSTKFHLETHTQSRESELVSRGGASPVIQQRLRSSSITRHFREPGNPFLERRSDFHSREFPMMSVIRFRVRGCVEKVIEVIVYATPTKA